MKTIISAVLVSLAILGCGFTPKPNEAPATLEAYAKQYAIEDQGALKSVPRVLMQGQTFVLTMPVPHPEEIAVETPDGTWFYFEDPSSLGSEAKAFSEIEHLELDSLKLEGARYLNGERTLGRVFSDTGEYRIYVTENLETEPENTWSMETTVFYLQGAAAGD